MDDEAFLCQYVPPEHRLNCRRLIPHLRQWCHDNAGKYRSAQEAAEPCKFVMTSILLTLAISILADVLSGLIINWLERHLVLA